MKYPNLSDVLYSFNRIWKTSFAAVIAWEIAQQIGSKHPFFCAAGGDFMSASHGGGVLVERLPTDTGRCGRRPYLGMDYEICNNRRLEHRPDRLFFHIGCSKAF